MGQGGRGNLARSSPYTLSRSVRDDFGTRQIGRKEILGSNQSMASSHSRSSSCDSSSASSSAGYIEHTVSKFDTLAGVAIKYGVEVADVKRMNGLITDLQMFALKTLKIPLPGRHPPTTAPNIPSVPLRQAPPRPGKHQSQAISNNLRSVTGSREAEKRPITSAMGLLRGYYGLNSTSNSRQTTEGTEMAVYKSDSEYHSEDELFSPLIAFDAPPASRLFSDTSLDPFSTSRGQVMDFDDSQPLGRRSKGKSKVATSSDFAQSSSNSASRSEAVAGEFGVAETERTNDRVFRRRSRGDGGSSASDIPYESYMGTEAEAIERVNAPLGKSSALRQKIPPSFDDEADGLSRPLVNTSALNGWHTSSQEGAGLGGSAVRVFSSSILPKRTSMEGLMSKVRRSASNPAFLEDKRASKGDSSGTLSVSQASSQAGVISSVLEGFPISGAIRRNKAAVD